MNITNEDFAIRSYCHGWDDGAADTIKETIAAIRKESHNLGIMAWIEEKLVDSIRRVARSKVEGEIK
jgi:hypothetical protein